MEGGCPTVRTNIVRISLFNVSTDSTQVHVLLVVMAAVRAVEIIVATEILLLLRCLL